MILLYARRPQNSPVAAGLAGSSSGTLVRPRGRTGRAASAELAVAITGLAVAE